MKQVLLFCHILSIDGVTVDPSKVPLVMDWNQPINSNEVRSFLELTGYYMKFIREFSTIAIPLHSLTKNDKKFSWNETCKKNFQKLKEYLTTSPALTLS